MGQSMGQTVDSKVVEMSFNNENFEQNAQQSIKTLGQLKDSLNLDGAAKGFEQIDKAAKNVSFRGIAEGVDQIAQKFTFLGTIAKRVTENIADDLYGVIKKGVAKVTSLPNQAWSLITQGGKARAFGVENARFMLEGLFPDDLDEVGKIMDNAMDSVDGTAYAFDSAAQAASQFAASGLKAGDQMYQALRAITGVAAMTNSEYENISAIFTTVAGNGKLMGDQLLQLSSRGLNAASTMAKFFNDVKAGAEGTEKVSEEVKKKIKELSGSTDVTEADIRDFVSKSKISFDIFSEAMATSFGDHAKKANETFNGALSNMKAALKKIGAKFYTPLIERNGPLVDLFNEVRIKINEVNKAIDPLVNLLSSGVIKAIETLTGLVKGFDFQNSGLKAFLDALSPGKVSAGDFLGLKKLKGVYVDTDKSISGVTGKLKQLDDTQKFITRPEQRKALETLFIETAKKHDIAIDDMIEKEGSFAKTLKSGWLTADLYNEALGGIKDLVNGTAEGSEVATEDLEKIREAALKVIRGDYGNDMEARFAKLTEEGFDAQQVQDYVNALHKAAGGTWNLTEETYAAADAAIKAGKSIEEMSDEQLKNIGYTEDQIKALRALQEEAEANGQTLAEYLAIEGVTDHKSGAELLLESFQNLISGLGRIAGSIKDAWNEIFPTTTSNAIYNFISGIHSLSENLLFSDKTVGKLKNTFKGLFSVVDIVARLFMSIAGPAIKAVFSVFKTISRLALSVLSPIGFAITKLDEFLKSIDAFGKVSRALEFAFGGIGKLLGMFKQWFLGLPGVQKFIDNFTDAFYKLGTADFIPAVTKAFSNFGKTVKDAFAKAGINIEPFINLVTAAFNKAKAIFDVIGGLGSKAFKRFSNAFKTMKLSSIKRAFENTFNDVKRTLKKAGIDVSPALDKMKAGFDKVKEAVSKVAEPFKKFGNVIGGLGSRAFKRFSNAFKTMKLASIKRAFENTFKDVKTAVLKSLSDAGINIKPFIDKITQGFAIVKSTVGSILKPIKELGTTIWGIASRGVGRLVDAFGSMDFGKIKTAVVDTFTDAKESIKTWFAGIDFGAIKDNAVTAFTAAKDAVVNWISGIDFGAIKDGAVNAFTTAKTAVVDWFSSIDFGSLKESAVNVFTTAKTAITDWFSSIDFGAVKETVSNAFTTVRDAVADWFSNIDFAAIKENVVTSLGDAKDAIADWFTNIDFGAIKDNIVNVFSNIKDLVIDVFKSLGVDISPIVDRLWTAFNDGLTVITGVGGKAFNFIKKLFKEFKAIPGLSTGFAKLKEGFGDVFAGIGPHLMGTWDKFKEFFGYVRDMGGVKLSNIGDIFRKFKDTVVEYFTNFEGFQKIKEAFVNIGTSIKDALEGWLGKFDLGKKFLNIKDSLVGAFKGIGPHIMDTWGKFKEFIAYVKDLGGFKLSNIGEIFSSFKDMVVDNFLNFDGFKGVGASVSDFFSGIFDKVPHFALFDTIVEKVQWVIDTVKSIFSGFELPESVSDLFGMVTEAAEAATDDIDKSDEKTESFIDKIRGIFEKIMEIAGFIMDHIGPIVGAVAGVMIFTKVLGLIGGISKFLKGSGKLKKGQAFKEFAKGVIIIAGAVILLVFAIKQLGDMEIGTLVQGGIALAAIFGILVFITKTVGKNEPAKSAKALSSMALLVAAVAASLFVLSMVPVKRLRNAAICLGGVMAIAALLSGVTGKVKPSTKALLVMVGMVVAVGLVLLALSKLTDPDSLIKVAASVAAVLLALSVSMIILSKISSFNMGAVLQAAGTLGIIVGIVALVAIVLGALDKLTGGFLGDSVDKGMEMLERVCTGIGRALGGLVGGFLGSGAEEALSHLPKIAEYIVAFVEALQPIQGMHIDVGPLLTILGTMLGAEFLGLLDGLASGITQATTGMNAVELFADELGKLADGIERWQTVMDRIDGITVDVGGIAKLAASIGLIDIGSVFSAITSKLDQFITGDENYDPVAKFAEDLTNLAAGIEGWQTVMDRVGEITIDNKKITKLCAAIMQINVTSIFNAITKKLDQFITGDADYDPVAKFAEDLTTLAAGIEGWQTVMERVGEAGIAIDNKGIAKLCASIQLIDITSVFDAVTAKVGEFITGDSEFNPIQEFATNLTDLASAIQGWQDLMDGITIEFDLGPIAGMCAAIEAVDISTVFTSASTVIDGFISGDDEENPIQKFGTNLKDLADALQGWNTAIAGAFPITFDLQPISDMSDAITEISFDNLYQTIANKVAEFIAGDDANNPVTQFGENLSGLADAINTWNEKTAGLKIDQSTITAIQQLETAVKNLPSVGGIIGTLSEFFTGTDAEKLESFKGNVEKLGEALVSFNGSLGVDIDVDRVYKLAKAAEALGSLVEAMVAISNYGATYTLPTFGGELVTFGGQLKSFTETEGLDAGKLSKLATSCSQLSLMTTRLIDIDLQSGDLSDASIVETFKTNIETVSSAISALATLDDSGVAKLTGAVENLNKTEVKPMAKNVPIDNESFAKAADSATDTMSSGIQKGSSEVASAASSVMSGVASVFGDTSGFINSGIAIIAAVASGMMQSSAMSDNARAQAQGAANAMREVDTTSTAYNFVSGFAHGIASYSYISEAAAKAMARRALEAVKATIKEGSPSRETYKSGKWFVYGLVNGIRDYTRYATSAATNLADGALGAMDSTISTLGRLFEQDIDAQPVITPVLDLSEIQNGALTIGDLLTFNDPIGVTGNMNAISANLNSRSQTSADDIVTALGTLQATLAENPGGNTYIVDGVTYDDGSNITSAVRTLINAVNVQNRVQ